MKNIQVELVAFLFSCFHFVLCLPVDEQTVSTLMKNNDIIKQCKNNPFLDQSYNECDLTVKESNLNYEKLRCLMLYDYNLRLCKNMQDNNTTITDEILNISKKNLTSTELCSKPTNISEHSLPEFPSYTQTLIHTLSDQKWCSILCSQNIYDSPYLACRLLLVDKVSETPEKSSNVKSLNTINSIEDTNLPPVVAIQEESKPSVIEANEPEKKENVESVKAAEPNVESQALETPKIIPQSQDAPAAQTVLIPQPEVVETSDNKEKVEKSQGINDIETKPVQNSIPVSTASTSKVTKQESNKKVETQINEQPGYDNFDDINQFGGGDDGLQNENEDYGNQPPLLEPEHTLKVSSNEKVKETVLDNGSKEPFEFGSANGLRYPLNADNSSFFPFFLIVMGVIVVIYILYHQKHKISKLIMGLLIEGRQGGQRRRNSRGHAYKRLDTLEQAMSQTSPNTTPSKVIY